MCQGVAAIIFEQGVMKNKGYDHFYFCLKWLKLGGGGTIWGQENNCWP